MVKDYPSARALVDGSLPGVRRTLGEIDTLLGEVTDVSPLYSASPKALPPLYLSPITSMVFLCVPPFP